MRFTPPGPVRWKLWLTDWSSTWTSVRAGADRGHRIPIRVLEVDRLVLANRADQVRVIRGQGVDSAVAEVVVGNRADSAAARRIVRDRDGRIRRPRQELLGRGDVPDQVGASRPEQGHDADHVRAGHRGALEAGVRRVARVRRTERTFTPGAEISASCAGAVDGDGAAAAEADEGVRDGGGTHGERGGVDGRRILNRAAGGPAVSG